jgi:TetR/AcrR family transcriptional repressor of lmrAB and yxaGH operons
MPRKAQHREPIIGAAVKLFRRNGYSRTGLSDIIAESNAPKGSLYHYFPDGKASIGVSAIEEAGRRIAATLASISERTETAGDMLQAYVRQLAKWMAVSGYRDGCPITTVVLELAPRDRAISDAGRKAYGARTTAFEQKFIADGFSPARARRLALVCAVAINGALVQSRIERNSRPLEIVAGELADLIHSTERA